MQKLFLFFVFLSFGCLVYSQTEQRAVLYDTSKVEKKTITKEHLKTYKTDKDFNYTETKKEDNFLDKAIRWFKDLLKQFWESIFGVGTATGFLFFIFNVAPYVVLAILLFFLIRFFLKVNSNNLIAKAKNNNQIIFSEEEQIIKNENIEALIDDAVTNKNYRLAIRYYYLLILKQLTETKHIDWQPQKTNKDYIQELQPTLFQKEFKDITQIYDYVWYGEFKVDAPKFEDLKQAFQNLNKNITID